MMGMFGGLLLGVLFLGLVVLVVVGIVFLVRALPQSNQNQMAATKRICDRCGKTAAPDWQVCPYCGESLRAK